MRILAIKNRQNELKAMEKLLARGAFPKGLVPLVEIMKADLEYDKMRDPTTGEYVTEPKRIKGGKVINRKVDDPATERDVTLDNISSLFAGHMVFVDYLRCDLSQYKRVKHEDIGLVIELTLNKDKYVARLIEIADYDKDAVAVANETYTIEVEWIGPFALDGSKWYNLDIRDSKWLNAVLDGDHYNNKNKGDVSDADLETAPYLWSFFGNPYQILIYNAFDRTQTLTHVGDFAVLQDGEYLWNVYKNNDGFGLECSDQPGNYVNDNGSRLGFWADPNNAKYDGGGKIKVFEAANPVVTSISSVAVSTNTNAVYNLNGQRVEAPAKGLYIQNGKKFVVK